MTSCFGSRARRYDLLLRQQDAPRDLLRSGQRSLASRAEHSAMTSCLYSRRSLVTSCKLDSDRLATQQGAVEVTRVIVSHFPHAMPPTAGQRSSATACRCQRGSRSRPRPQSPDHLEKRRAPAHREDRRRCLSAIVGPRTPSIEPAPIANKMATTGALNIRPLRGSAPEAVRDKRLACPSWVSPAGQRVTSRSARECRQRSLC